MRSSWRGEVHLPGMGRNSNRNSGRSNSHENCPPEARGRRSSFVGIDGMRSSLRGRRGSSSSSEGVESMAMGDWATLVRKNHHNISIDDFSLGRTIGKGRYARVRLITMKGHEKRPLCLKVLKKKEVHDLNQVEHIINERDVLNSIRHPLIIQMLQTFQDKAKLYMALELVNGGELFEVLRREGKFKLEQARFYMSEVTSCISYIHEMLIVYRDIKPENILIHASGHIRLSDFGFAKYLKGEKTYTTCGTAEYMAPEIIRNLGHGLSVDWWAAGVLLFEMLAGKPPFSALEENELWRIIVNGRVVYPPGIDQHARDLVARLLMLDPVRRIHPGVTYQKMRIQDHTFFKNLSWKDVDAGKARVPWKPNIVQKLMRRAASKDQPDVTNFQSFEESDEVVTQEMLSVDQVPFEDWETAQDFSHEARNLAMEIRAQEDAIKEEAQRLEQERKDKDLEQIRLEDEADEARDAADRQPSSVQAPPLARADVGAEQQCCGVQ
uniref:Protein kinase domain-containing protein n=1 Tax=Noctiluca scintillans TaxID=2966 RepID=A0A7S1ATD8_NOCSC|mmetsp:Transcript_59302/g.157888  ORF Transcript_59302/g.157888 Transcript_59302/m.157888 type:complete len:495 (+) Transcript_59302:68-1552(+)